MRNSLKVIMALFLIFFSSSVFAAGFDGMKDSTPSATFQDVTPYNWSGVYFGAQAGFGVGTSENDVTLSDEEDSIPFLSSIDEISGALYGAHVGFNYHRNRMLFGIEGTFDLTDTEGEATAPGQLGSLLHTKTTVDWIATAVARVGIASGRTLFYGVGGAAWAGVELQSDLTLGVNLPNSTIPLTRNDDTRLGWTLGLGVEHAIDDHTTVKVQYNHYDFGKESFSNGVSFDGEDTGITASHSNKLKFNAIKIGVSYKFN